MLLDTLQFSEINRNIDTLSSVTLTFTHLNSYFFFSLSLYRALFKNRLHLYIKKIKWIINNSASRCVSIICNLFDAFPLKFFIPFAIEVNKKFMQKSNSIRFRIYFFLQINWTDQITVGDVSGGLSYRQFQENAMEEVRV